MLKLYTNSLSVRFVAICNMRRNESLSQIGFGGHLLLPPSFNVLTVWLSLSVNTISTLLHLICVWMLWGSRCLQVIKKKKITSHLVPGLHRKGDIFKGNQTRYLFEEKHTLRVVEADFPLLMSNSFFSSLPCKTKPNWKTMLRKTCLKTWLWRFAGALSDRCGFINE